MNGGILVTGGDLLVQGLADGHVEFRDATNGRLLRRLFIGTGVVAPPVSYRVGREQFIAVAAGWNGVRVDADPPGAEPPYDNSGRLIVLKLDGGPVRVAARRPAPPPIMSGGARPSPEAVARGRALYVANCARCHGYMGETTPFPDLRRLTPETLAAFDEIVLRGAYRQAGMASFADVLGPSDTRDIRAYLTAWAQGS
jgi:quinohemoprotein ethanol dehydrogenase